MDPSNMQLMVIPQRRSGKSEAVLQDMGKLLQEHRELSVQAQNAEQAVQQLPEDVQTYIIPFPGNSFGGGISTIETEQVESSMNPSTTPDPTARLAQALAKLAKECGLQLHFVGANADQFNAAIKENKN